MSNMHVLLHSLLIAPLGLHVFEKHYSTNYKLFYLHR